MTARTPLAVIALVSILAFAAGILAGIAGINSASRHLLGFDAPATVALPALGASAILLALGVGGVLVIWGRVTSRERP